MCSVCITDLNNDELGSAINPEGSHNFCGLLKVVHWIKKPASLECESPTMKR